MVIHVSVAVLRDGQILLVREGKPASYGKWNLPGGHLEPFEELARGAAREVREEEILELRWADPGEVARMKAETLLNPAKLRKICSDLLAGQRAPATIITEGVYGPVA